MQSTVDKQPYDLIGEFKKRHNAQLVPEYQDREARNRWAATQVRTFPGRRVLNLGGGGKRHLARHLGADWQVHELDIEGDCDTQLNLDTVERLPFDDGAFDTCCAFDVLEHLERFHLIAHDMYRVARTTMLISLPNAATEVPVILRNIREYNDPGQNGIYSKYYGLPLSPPGDRHRWWLTFEDIVRFWLHFAELKSCKVEFFVPNDEFSLKRRLFRLLAGERLYLNFFCSSVWIKVSK
jgi:hypothetical protein